MFFTLADLRLAVDDKDSWSDLRLPVRLKLEMKRLLQSNYGINMNTSPTGQVKWKRCFSQEYDSHYFLNLETNEVYYSESFTFSNIIYYSRHNGRNPMEKAI